MGYKMKSKKTERGFLTPVELDALKDKCFDNERLNQVKDMFLFSCYTGLASIDLFNLSPKSIIIGMDGGKWISIHRQKTEIASRVPLLSGAMDIIERYDWAFINGCNFAGFRIKMGICYLCGTGRHSLTGYHGSC